jgi:diguanylate cyclase (GGDEF)-like protein
VTAPIIVDGLLWGEFYATRHVGEPCFGEGERSYLEVLVAILAGAVSRALREQSLEQLAFQDPLTGLLNRRALDERAATSFEAPLGSAHPVTALAVDINDLKAVNDSAGHDAGDQLIRSVARSLATHFARFPGALVARTGGDEFCVLVPRQDPDRVVEAGDEVCRVAWESGIGGGVSCGAATALVTSGSELTPADLFSAADRAQYVAKRARLTRTALAGDLPDAGLSLVPEPA